MKLNYEAGKRPTKFELGVGEVAYNVPDKLMYTKLIDGSIVVVAGDDFVTWVDLDTALVALTTTENVLLSVTLGEATTAEESAYKISGLVDNTSQQTATMTVRVYSNGVFAGLQTVDLAKGETGRPFTFTGVLGSSNNKGDVITISFAGSSSGDLDLRGDVKATTFEIRKYH